jgi:lysozyme
MITSAKGLILIEHYEGFRPDTYKCQAGVWTNGYGTTIYPDGTTVKEGDVVTQEQARFNLSHDVKRYGSTLLNTSSIVLSVSHITWAAVRFGKVHY